MQHKKQLLRRLMTIYIVYFALLAGGFVHQIAPLLQGFLTGRAAAIQDIRASKDQGVSVVSHFLSANLLPFNTEREPSQNFTSGNTSIEVTYPKADLKVTVRDGKVGHGLFTAFIFDFVIMGAQLAIFALMGFIINSLRRCIQNERPLPRANIVRTRWIGVLILTAELFSGLSNYIENKAAASLLAGTELTVNTAFDISYWNLFMGILILFTAEVFAIGHKLGEEQKLTI